MCGNLDFYVASFANLRVDKNRRSWSRLTLHSSPYKPFLLLSILDHIASGRITSNYIEPSFELVQTFLGYMGLMPDLNRQSSMAYPFYHLESAKFWRLIERPDRKHLPGRTIKTITQLRRFYLGARFDDELFHLLQISTNREILRETLILGYFTPEFQPAVSRQSVVNCASDRYSFKLLGANEKGADYIPACNVDLEEQRVRDQGFRKAIVQLYDHRCALCGIKMQTPEGRTVVDAAHIVPWCESRDDAPTNGMALCKLCHWSFDNGLMSVDAQYLVKISTTVKEESNLPGHILTLSDRPMLRPPESRFWPAQENFDWHRKQRFRR